MADAFDDLLAQRQSAPVDPVPEPAPVEAPPLETPPVPAAPATPSEDPFAGLFDARAQQEQTRIQVFGDVRRAVGNPEEKAAVLEVTRKTGLPSEFVAHELPYWKKTLEFGTDEELYRRNPELRAIVLDNPALGEVVVNDKPLNTLQAVLKYSGLRLALGFGYLDDLETDTTGAPIAGGKPEASWLRNFDPATYVPGMVAGVSPAVEKQTMLKTPLSEATGLARGEMYVEEAKRSFDAIKLGWLSLKYIGQKWSGADTYDTQIAAADLKNKMVPLDYQAGTFEQVGLDAMQFFGSHVVSMGTALAGTVVGGPVLGATLGFGTSFAMEISNLWDYKAMTDDQGRPMDDSIAIGNAIAYASVAAVIETSENILVWGKLFGPVGKLGSKVEVKKFLDTIAKDPIRKKLLSDVAQRWAKTAASEGVEEAAQQVAQDVFGWMGRSESAGKAEGGWFSPQKTDMVGSIGDAFDTFATATVGSFLMGAAPAGKQAYQFDRWARQSRAASERLAAITGLAKESPTARAAPAAFVRVVEAETEATGEKVSAAWISPDGVVRLAQSQNLDPAELLRQAIGEEAAQRFQEALASGQKMQVPLQEYVEKWTPSGLAEPLLADTTTRQGYQTIRERKTSEADFDKEVAAALKQIEEEKAAPVTPYEELLGRMADELGKAQEALGKKVTKKDVQKLLANWRAMVTVSAARSGLERDDVARMLAVKIAAEPNVKGVAAVQALVQQAMKQGERLAVETPEFKAWFKESKVVDAQGQPVVVYRGAGRDEGPKSGEWFTDRPDTASGYAQGRADMFPVTGAANVTPAYLSLQNPLVVDARHMGWDSIMDPRWEGELTTDEVVEFAKEHGHDGVIIKNLSDQMTEEGGIGTTYVAFNDGAAKSIFNRGTFDASTPNILQQEVAAFNRADPAGGTTRLEQVERDQHGNLKRDAQGNFFPEYKRRYRARVEAMTGKNGKPLYTPKEVEKKLADLEIALKIFATHIDQAKSELLPVGADMVPNPFETMKVQPVQVKNFQVLRDGEVLSTHETKEQAKAEKEAEAARIAEERAAAKKALPKGQKLPAKPSLTVGDVVASTKYEVRQGRTIESTHATQEEADAALRSFPRENLRWRLPGEGASLASEFGPLRFNQDELYVLSLDLSALCRKRLEAAATANEVRQILKDSLSNGERVVLISVFKQQGRTSPCLYCYVESPRGRAEEMVKDSLAFIFDDKPIPEHWKPDRKALLLRAVQQAKANNLTRDSIDINWWADPSTRKSDAAQKKFDAARDIYTFITAEVLSTKQNAPKLYEEYAGQIQYLSRDFIDYVNGRAGLRRFSTSDYQDDHIVDLVQATLDQDLVQLKGHSYTKTEEYVHIFGDTREKIQISLFANEDEVTGAITEDTHHGQKWEFAKAARKKHKDVGTVFVATSDAQVRWALDQKWIDYIIPFHHSGLPKKYYSIEAWQDYTHIQKEKWADPEKHKDKNGKAEDVPLIRMWELGADKGAKKGQSAEDHNVAMRKRYLKLLKERGLSPPFADFFDHPQYIKLRKDYARTDTPFVPIDASGINYNEVKKALDRVWAGDLPKEIAVPDIVEKMVALRKWIDSHPEAERTELLEGDTDVGTRALKAAKAKVDIIEAITGQAVGDRFDVAQKPAKKYEVGAIRQQRPGGARQQLQMVEGKETWVELPGDPPRGRTMLQQGSLGQIDTPEFREWFGSSKATTDAGGPLVLFHGTGQTFDEFQGGWIYLTPSSSFADKFATSDKPLGIPPAASQTFQINTRDGMESVEGWPSAIAGVAITNAEGVFSLTHTQTGLAVLQGFESYEEARRVAELAGPKIGKALDGITDEQFSKIPKAKKAKLWEALSSARKQEADESLSELAFGYSASRGRGSGVGVGSQVLPLYARVEKPLDLRSLPARKVSTKKFVETLVAAGLDVSMRDLPFAGRDLYQILNQDSVRELLREKALEAGYDGIVYKDFFDEKSRADSYIVFGGDQVKSALGNTGKFSRTSKSLTDAGLLGSPAFQRWFQGSQVVDAGGRPLVQYHGTTSDKEFSVFKDSGGSHLGFHFGSAEAANERLNFFGEKATSRILPVYLSIKNPLRISDEAGSWSGYYFFEMLRSAGLLDREEVSDLVDMGGKDDGPLTKRQKRYILDTMELRGFDGFVYENTAEGGGDSWAALYPSQVKSAIANRGTYSPESPNYLEQTPGDPATPGPRGWLETAQVAGRRLLEIFLTQRADLSTFLHESGHAFWELKADLAERPDAPASVKADYEAALKWMGVASRQELAERSAQANEIRAAATAEGRAITADEEARILALLEPFEKWARGFEAYLMTGKAPSLSLAGAFAQFKLWLTEVYKHVRNLRVDLDPEIIGIFDRMLATDEEITAAGRAIGITGEALEEAKTRAELDALKEVARTHEEWWKKKAKVEKAKAEEDYEALPARRAWAFLKRGEGTEALKALGQVKLDYRAVADIVGIDVAERLFRGVLQKFKQGTGEAGIHPDRLAALLGGEDGKALLEQMVKMPGKTAWVDARTSERMAALYPGILEERTRLEALVQQALHDEPAIVDEVHRQWAEDRKAAGTQGKTPSAEAARAAARVLISRQTVQMADVKRYQRAERQEALKRAAAKAKGDLEAAAMASQKRLLNFSLWKEAEAAMARAEKTRDLATELLSAKGQGRLGLASPVARDFILRLLEASGFVQGIPAEAKNAGLAELGKFFDALEPSGQDATLEFDSLRLEELLRNPKSFEDMTIADADNLRSALLQIRAAVREKTTILLDNERVALDAVSGDIRNEASRLPAVAREARSKTARKIRQGTFWGKLRGYQAMKRDPLTTWLDDE